MVAMGMFANERVELLDGVLVESGLPGPEHIDLVTRLSSELVHALAERATVRIEAPLAASELSEPAPDIAVVARGSDADELPSTALLIVEVDDRAHREESELKAKVYAAAGVREYWCVDLAQRRIDVATDPGPDGYTSVRTAGPGEVLSPIEFPDFKLPFERLFA